jgi:RNA recognition motif-containing protein
MKHLSLALQVHAGWAHVTYADLEAAQRAVAQLPGSNLLGNRIRAHFAQPEPIPPVLPDPAVLAAKQELIAVRKAQYHRRRARRVSSLYSDPDENSAGGFLAWATRSVLSQ